MLDEGPQYTSFLNAQGRVLFDAFLIPAPEGAVLIEAEVSALKPLSSHLLRYKLRSKASVSDVSDDYSVIVNCGTLPTNEASGLTPAEGGGWVDPRLPSLGVRALVPTSSVISPPEGSVEAPAEQYALQLALTGVFEGARAFPEGEALPLESNIELLHGISFRKGCYLGQELTARTHFRGVVRKRLVLLVARPLAEAAESELARSRLPELPAFSHLSSHERSLAAVILAQGGGGWDDLREEAAEDGTGVAAEVDTMVGLSLNDESGKSSAKLRAYMPSWGLGCGLCRLSALDGRKIGGVLSNPRGTLSVVPVRPDWWPESISPVKS